MTNSRAGAQALDLRLLRYAADHQRGLRHVLVRKLFVLLVNLHGEFTRRQQHQRADALDGAADVAASALREAFR